LGSEKPRRNHVIAQILLRNFVDDSQYLHILNKRKPKPYKSTPRKAFVEKNGYVRHKDGGEQDDYEVEKKLCEIEGAAAPAIERIIASVRHGDFPKLSSEHQRALKCFFFTSHLRNRDRASQIVNELGYDNVIYGVICRALSQQGLPYPAKELYDSDRQWANIQKRFRHDSIASLAAGLPRQVDREMERYADRVGILIGVIEEPNVEFVIGSCGPASVAPQQKKDPLARLWLPISYNVAITLTPFPDKELLYPLNRKEVQRLNNASFKESSIIAARSKRHLQPFMQGASKSQLSGAG